MDKQEKPTTESKKPTPAHHSRLPLWALGLAGVIVVGLFIWKVPQLQVKGAHFKDRIKLENDARNTLVQAFAGLGLFVTAYFGFQNLKVAQENLEETRKKQAKDAEIAQRNLAATEEKQVTERFAKAVELLGNTSIHVRLGAIYALERISKDSDRDYWQVMEILTAYIRETSPYLPREKSDKEYTSFSTENKRSTKTDIQAVLTVISRRTKSYKYGEENYLYFGKSNLERANLQGANLSSAYLAGALLAGANLAGANLAEANLAGAVLTGAILERANLTGANLEKADLSGADLTDAQNLTRHLLQTAKNYNKIKDYETINAKLRD